MANELVAWSPIRSAKNTGTTKDPEFKTINVKPGDTVTQDSLGIDDDGWAQLLDSGAVRLDSFPDIPETYSGSPVEYLRERAAKAAEGGLGAAETSPENMAAILAANNAATGNAALATDPAFDEEVAAEMDRQKEENSPGSSTEDVTPPTSTVEYRVNDGGTLLASDDGGSSWRKATDEERAAYKQ